MKQVLLALLLGTFLCTSAQEYRDDAQLRAHLSLETRLSKRFTFHLDQQYRFTNNIGMYRRGSVNPGLTYKVNKHIKLLGSYTFIHRINNAGDTRHRHWFQGSVMLRQDVGHWRFVGRIMMQARNGNFGTEKQNLTRYYNRNKLSVRYSATKRITLFVSEEIYIPLNNPQMKGIERSRTAAGTVINTFRHQQLELYFMLQQRHQHGDWWDQSDKYPDFRFRRDFIYGVGYAFEF